MSRFEAWLPEKIQGERRAIPSWAANRGALRLETAAGLIGAEEAQRVARKEGRYELADEVAREIRLHGLKISNTGEFPALSPANWLQAQSQQALPLIAWRKCWEAEGVELVGILLDAEDRRAFLRFLAATSTESVSDVWDLLEIADHFFHAGHHRLAVSRNF